MARNTIVIDACLAITFGNARALHVIAALQRHEIAIGSRAVSEVTLPPASEDLSRLIAGGGIDVAAIDLGVGLEQEALVRLDASPKFRGRGDAEVLALAATRGWIVGSDDVAVRRTAEVELGQARIAGTLDVLRWAVAENRLTVTAALELLDGLDVGPGLARRIAAAGRNAIDILAGK